MQKVLAFDRHEYIKLFDKPLEDNVPFLRKLCQEDLFFLLVYVLKCKFVDNDWGYARCNEVQANPDGCLDLWAREHLKSTIITFGKTIQDILINPEITVGLASHSRKKALDFLNQIKVELETNNLLKSLFPEILYQNPKKESPCWNADRIVVKRKGNPKEGTVEGWGLENQPTGQHYSLRVYDDVVTAETVYTPEQIKKTLENFELSVNLGARGGRVRYIGTRYHYNDLYATLLERKVVEPRIYPATHNGKIDGNPVYLTQEELIEKRQIMGDYTFSCQMMQSPVMEDLQVFIEDDIRYYRNLGGLDTMNIAMLVDPANSKKQNSDYTSIWVVGLGQDENYYIIDIVRDKLDFMERAKIIFDLHRKYKPQVVAIEKYGMMLEKELLTAEMDRQNYHFSITEVGGSEKKEDRIRKLQPLFQQHKFYFPPDFVKVDYTKRRVDLVEVFIREEYKAFPFGSHDDMLDSLARLLDIQLSIPYTITEEKLSYDFSGIT